MRISPRFPVPRAHPLPSSSIGGVRCPYAAETAHQNGNYSRGGSHMGSKQSRLLFILLFGVVLITLAPGTMALADSANAGANAGASANASASGGGSASANAGASSSANASTSGTGGSSATAGSHASSSASASGSGTGSSSANA